MKVKAKKLGLWNLFLSKAHYPEHGVPLTNLEVNAFSVSSRTIPEIPTRHGFLAFLTDNRGLIRQSA